jgi:hypothetical protein
MDRELELPRPGRVRPKTGPLPTVTWEQLRRPSRLEDHLPMIFFGGFVLLALIQIFAL